MSTRIVDRYGVPHETREVRQRMGFLPGELDAAGSEPVTFTTPAFEMPATERTSDGHGEPPMAKARP